MIGMGLSTCSLDARSVLGVFDGARARVLESEHMLVLARARGCIHYIREARKARSYSLEKTKARTRSSSGFQYSYSLGARDFDARPIPTMYITFKGSKHEEI